MVWVTWEQCWGALGLGKESEAAGGKVPMGIGRAGILAVQAKVARKQAAATAMGSAAVPMEEEMSRAKTIGNPPMLRGRPGVGQPGRHCCQRRLMGGDRLARCGMGDAKRPACGVEDDI